MEKREIKDVKMEATHIGNYLQEFCYDGSSERGPIEDIFKRQVYLSLLKRKK